MSDSVSSSLVRRGWSLSFSSWLVKLPKAKSVVLWTVQTAGYIAGANKVVQYFVNTYSEPRTLWPALGGSKSKTWFRPHGGSSVDQVSHMGLGWLGHVHEA